MCHFLFDRLRVVSIYMLVLGSTLPCASQAQGKKDDFAEIAHICMVQNWDTPSVKAMMGNPPAILRAMMLELLPNGYGSDVNQCLKTRKIAPAAVCDGVIDQIYHGEKDAGAALPPIAVTKAEHDLVMTALAPGNCDPAAPRAYRRDWKAPSIEPDPDTLELINQADRGDVVAQINVAQLYMRGMALPEDQLQARNWIARAVGAGSSQAQYQLALWIEDQHAMAGLDRADAMRLLTLAANQGHALAMAKLASIYQSIGSSQAPMENRGLAVVWLRKSAEAGNAAAAAELAKMYEFGIGMQADQPQAIFWYRKAATGRDAVAMERLAEYAQRGAWVEMDARAAQAWRRKADALGNNGKGRLLKYYFPLLHCPQDSNAMAASLLDLAAGGDIDAQLAVAVRYGDGDGLVSDPVKASYWWRQAAQAGDPIAQRMLAKLLMDEAKIARSRGERINPDEALSWMQKAVAQGDTQAKVDLVMWYLHGEYRSSLSHRLQDGEKARLLAREASAEGHVNDELKNIIERMGLY